MSVDAGIYLNLICYRGPVAILDALLASKWSRHEEGWSCVPLGEDPSERILLDSDDIKSVRSLFVEKIARAEVFGITLWWDSGEVGGDFLVLPNSHVIFSPTLNRLTLGARATDVSWYVSRILPLFRCEDGVVVESWEWRETA